MDARTYETLVALNPETVARQFLQATPNTEKTRRAYERDLSHYFEWAREAGIHPLTVEHGDLNRFLRHVETHQTTWGKRTRGRLYGTLRSFFSFVSARWNVLSPMEHPDILPHPEANRDQDAPPLVLTFQDFRQVMSTALTELPPPFALAIALLGINGLKPGEVTAANVDDVAEEDGQLLLRLPARSERAMTPLVGAEPELAAQVVKGRYQGPLLLNHAGNRMQPSNIARALRRVAASLNLDESPSAQLLRNTAGVLAATTGTSAHGLTEMLGISPRRLHAFLAHAASLPEKHGAYQVWRFLAPERTDNELLDQVDRLLADPTTHPIAPIAVAGAALEQHLRMLCELHEAEVKGEPSIDRYKAALMREGLMPSRTATRIDGWRNLRNDAAHGHERVSHQDAEEMARGVRAFVETPFGPEATGP